MISLGNYVILVYLQLFLWCDYGIFATLDMYEGDACLWKGKVGVCAVLSECESLAKDLRERKISPYDLEKCAFKDQLIVVCCPDKVPNATTSTNTQPGSNENKKNTDFYFPPNTTTTVASPTKSSFLSENADGSENGNSIAVELTTVGTNGDLENDAWAPFEFRDTTPRPARDIGASDQSIDKIIDNIFNSAQQTVSTIKPVTTTTPRPNNIGFIDLSRKRTTTTVKPTLPSLNQSAKNVETVWVVQDSSSQQPIVNDKIPNWNQPSRRQQPQQNIMNSGTSGPITNWNVPKQQPNSNWNNPSQDVKVIVVEEEPKWNSGNSRFRHNWGGQNFQSSVINPNSDSSFRNSQIQTQHHAWNGNSFNQVPILDNLNFVKFPNQVAPPSSNDFEVIGVHEIQIPETKVAPINPENPFLKPVLNPNPVQQASGKLIQLQPNVNRNTQWRFQRF